MLKAQVEGIDVEDEENCHADCLAPGHTVSTHTCTRAHKQRYASDGKWNYF